MVLFVSVLNATHVGLLRGEYICNNPLGDDNSNIPLAFKTVSKLAGFIQYNQSGRRRRKENEPCEK